LLTRGSHRSGRAALSHPVPQITPSLRRRRLRRLSLSGDGTGGEAGRTGSRAAGRRVCGASATYAKHAARPRRTAITRPGCLGSPTRDDRLPITHLPITHGKAENQGISDNAYLVRLTLRARLTARDSGVTDGPGGTVMGVCIEALGIDRLSVRDRLELQSLCC
jgi:hypothetical protein